MNKTDYRLFFDISRDVGHERQILHQSTSLSFWRVARTQHAPLAGLQRSGSTDLTCLLKLRRYPGHHAESRYEREPAEDMRNAGTVHLEPLQRPIPGGNGANEASSDVITLELHRVERVKLAGPLRFLQHLVNCRFQICVESLEQILE